MVSLKKTVEAKTPRKNEEDDDASSVKESKPPKARLRYLAQDEGEIKKSVAGRRVLLKESKEGGGKIVRFLPVISA